MSRRARSPKRQQKRTILLTTNGHVTEKQYLDELRRRANGDKSLNIVTRHFAGKDPNGVLKKLANPQGDISEFDEVWVVVDHDGTDRRDFLRRCEAMSSKSTVVRGVVSVPCFEVWLIAHYKQIGRYPNQAAAQLDLAKITHRDKAVKELPTDFPCDRVAEACDQCHLPDDNPPRVNDQGGPSSTGMPHLISALGLVAGR